MVKNKFLKSKKIRALKKYLEKEKSVILAFLFGSFAKGFEMKESDVDIGVYLKDKRKKTKIWLEVQRILEREVDLVCLDEAPASLVSEIFETGISLKLGDEKLYWELYLTKSAEAEDFLEFLKDFREIKEKAKSLTKGAETRLLIRFDYLKDGLKEISRFQNLSFDEYKNDIDKRRIVERWTETTINATLDIAKIILASEKKERPKTYGDVLLDFGVLIGLNEKEAEEFSEFADLRNILAHEYLEVIYGRIQNFIKECPKFYEKIFDFLEKYLEKK